MKRLKQYLLMLDKNNTTYEPIYLGAYGYTKRGEMILNNAKMKGKTDKDSDYETEVFQDSTYWYGDISFYFFRTHKLCLDKPSILIKIPYTKIGLSRSSNKVVVADYALRFFEQKILELNYEIYNRSRPDKENGAFYCQHPYTTIRERNSSFVSEDATDSYLNLLIMVQLPQNEHKKASKMLCNMLPNVVNEFVNEFDLEAFHAELELYDLQQSIRKWLKDSQYCCFIANGSILPHESEEGEKNKSAVPFISPKEDEIEVFGIKGMGIKRGVTIIIGGGYSGKSTMLDAIAMGVYNHISGDGRELVITDDTALKISAEDGRNVHNVNISPFIKWLPQGDTKDFTTQHASGSTSQAANVIEAINIGSKLLLVDEDKSATNFMIRDSSMQELIENEPIIPFCVRVRELYESEKVSTILVIGGSGEFIGRADNIYIMKNYELENCTKKAKETFHKYFENKKIEKKAVWKSSRFLLSDSFSAYSSKKFTEILEISDMGYVRIGDDVIDLRMIHALTTYEQACAIGFIIRQMTKSHLQKEIKLEHLIKQTYEKIYIEGLEEVFSTAFVADRWLELPREIEVMWAINRMKYIRYKVK